MTVRQLAELVSGEVLGDGDVPIVAARPLTEAGPGDITFVDGDRNLPAWHASPAAAAVVPQSVPLNGRPLIRVADPLDAFAAIVLNLRGGLQSFDRRIDASAVIHPSAVIGQDVAIGPHCVIGAESQIGDRAQLAAGVSIGRRCRIGADCILHPHVVLYDGSLLGNRIIIHANSVVGADGFGYRTQNGQHMKVPQLGHVEVGDDVEIGACTTIDRGTFGPTRIGSGSKIDNLVMIGHNCQIGRNNLLVAQVGIAGSSSTGDYVVMAGQAGVADHVHVGDRAVIGAQGGVIRDVPAGSRMLGYPARPDRQFFRISLAEDQLPGLLRDVRQIRESLGLEEKE
jgi:UDP-3-O-[3-hydroxymyristoyl] glucosamine N-acyltransferase